MPLQLELEPLLVVHEMDNGNVYAHPLADVSAVCRARTVEEAIELQRAYLSKRLSKIDAEQIADYVFVPQTELLEIPVVLPRADLPVRIRVTGPLTVACAVVPDGDDRWLHIPSLGHVAFVPTGENLEDRARREVERVVTARQFEATEYRSLWPPRRTHLRRCTVDVERQYVDDLGARATERRKRAKARKSEAADKLLREIGEDWTSLERPRQAPVLEREREVRTVQSLVGGTERLAVALVGPQGAGKSAIVRAVANARPSVLGSRKLFATSGTALVAGQSGFGQLAERLETVMRAAEELDAVLYFDDLGDLFAGHSGSIEDLAAIMRPYLAQSRVRIVGELSPEQWEHHERRHVGFFSLLHRVEVEPMSARSTGVLLRRRLEFEREHEPERPRLVEAAVGPLVELAERYLSYESFPGKAIRVYEELRAVAEGETTESGEPKPIEAGDVYRGFSVRSGIPMFLLRDDRVMKAAEVETFFGRSVIGQRQAIERIAQTLCVVKAGLAPPAKPLANFLFVGPTGIGKTEVAKTLARFLFGASERMVRFDMSEFMDPLAAERLIRGTDRDEGELTRKVRQQPFCVVLLDEIEKAHPSVFDLLLQVCGEGRLSDARGKTTYFHNAIIIMTSNLGAAHRRAAAGFDADSSPRGEREKEEAYYLEQVERHFRPEFVNRLDRVIPFHALGLDEIAAVAGVTLERIVRRDGLLHRGARLHVEERALAELATGGYSEQYGARALRRHLEDALVAPVASLVARLGPGGDGATIHVQRVADDPVELDGVGALVESSQTRQLLLRTFKAEARKVQAASSDLQYVASLRRMAHRCAHVGPVEQMRERLDYLVADLAAETPAGRDQDSGQPARTGSVIAAMSVEHAMISSTLRSVDDAVAAVENAEELAMAAQEEGEAVELLRHEAEEAFAGFERAFVRAVLSTAHQDETVFVVRGVEHPRAIRHWLLPFLAGAERRQWMVTVHRQADDEPADVPWTSGGPWGPPRRGNWARGRLNKAKDADLIRHWKAVLVRLRGPLCGSILGYELGLCRYLDLPDGTGLHHVELIGMGDAYEVTATDLGRDAYALPERIKPAEAKRTQARRVWEADGTIAVGESSFRPGDDFDYWDDIERVLFASVAKAALAGEEFDD